MLSTTSSLGFPAASSPESTISVISTSTKGQNLVAARGLLPTSNKAGTSHPVSMRQSTRASTFTSVHTHTSSEHSRNNPLREIYHSDASADDMKLRAGGEPDLDFPSKRPHNARNAHIVIEDDNDTVSLAKPSFSGAKRPGSREFVMSVTERARKKQRRNSHGGLPEDPIVTFGEDEMGNRATYRSLDMKKIARPYRIPK